MKVADLLNPWQAGQCVRQVNWVIYIASYFQLNARRVSGKAAGELSEAESWKRRHFSLAGRKCLGHLRCVLLPNAQA